MEAPRANNTGITLENGREKIARGERRSELIEFRPPHPAEASGPTRAVSRDLHRGDGRRGQLRRAHEFPLLDVDLAIGEEVFELERGGRA